MSPRYRRGLRMLLPGEVTAMTIAIGAGISNVSAWLFEMRSRGLVIPCRMTTMLNRDGQKCRVGKFSLTEADRKMVRTWLGE